MGITNSNKQISVNQIDCQGTLRVTLALTATPDISSNPTDIVLVLDRSGSMSGTPLANLKIGAKTFIDIIDEATDGSEDGHIGSGSRIGIVSFASTATVDAPLITSTSVLKTAVDGLTADGLTNHGAAFATAAQLFDPNSTNAKVIVMFTDGKTTTGPDPNPIAAAARAQGITIYCIGLVGSDGVDPATLNEWATDPDSSHVAITPDDADLEDLFADLAANISKAGATDIQIDEIIQPDFVIQSIEPATKGMAAMIDSRTIRWTIDELGVTSGEGASLSFIIRHIAQTSGLKKVNESIVYSDNENNSVTFPDPSVQVDCGTVITPEECPVPIDVNISGCQDTIEYSLGDSYLQSLGRIAQLDVNIKNVCPGKRVALAVILTETDDEGNEYPRGMKAFTVPAHYSPACRDVLVKCVKFVLPEDLNVSGGDSGSLCTSRNLKARVITHYIDNDFECCSGDPTPVDVSADPCAPLAVITSDRRCHSCSAPSRACTRNCGGSKPQEQ